MRILRFDGAKVRDPDIDAWLGAQAPALSGIATACLDLLRNAGPGLRELLHDGWPTVCIEDAALACVQVYGSHVNLSFYQGAALPDPKGMLEGKGKFMRHVKLRPGASVSDEALQALVAASYWDLVERLSLESRANSKGGGQSGHGLERRGMKRGKGQGPGSAQI